MQHHFLVIVQNHLAEVDALQSLRQQQQKDTVHAHKETSINPNLEPVSLKHIAPGIHYTKFQRGSYRSLPEEYYAI